jgi:acylphosphatase
MAEAGDRVCWTVQFSGMVQGVGFRYQTERVARAFDVTGYVRNMPDGQVEVVAEGVSGEVQRFLAAVEDSMVGYIRGRQRHEGPATGAYDEFTIRH